MRLEEVLPALREGKKIRRASQKNFCFTSCDKTLYCLRRVDGNDNEWEEYFKDDLDFEDILAGDWEVTE